MPMLPARPVICVRLIRVICCFPCGEAERHLYAKRNRSTESGVRRKLMTAAGDPFANFKAAQREGWSVFAPVEIFTTMPAAKLVKFAQVAAGQRVLDVACGTGVV